MAEPRIALVYSLSDPAGRGVASRLAERPGWERCSLPWKGSTCLRRGDGGVVLAGFHEETVEMEFLDSVLPETVEAYIVLSRHASTSGKPTLSLHYPGNPGPDASLGGRPWELAWTWPRLFAALTRLYYREAEKRGLLGRYSFSLEATHHGPTSLSKPVVFIEIGSTPSEWEDATAQEAMAEAVWRLLENTTSLLGETRCKHAIGIGGTHYPDKHTRLQLSGEICYGHIFAKYTFPHLNEELLLQALEKSRDRIEAIVLLKAPSRVKNLAKEFAEKHGLQLLR